MPKGRNVPAQTLQRLLLKLEVSLEGEAGCKKSPLTTPPPPPRGFIHSKRTQWGRDLLMWSYRVGYDGGGRGRTHRCRNVCPPSSLQHLGEFSFAWEAGAPSFAWQSARCVGYWLCQRPSRVTLAAASAEPRRRRVPTQRNAHVPTLPKLRLTSKFPPTKIMKTSFMEGGSTYDRKPIESHNWYRGELAKMNGVGYCWWPEVNGPWCGCGEKVWWKGMNGCSLWNEPYFAWTKIAYKVEYFATVGALLIQSCINAMEITKKVDDTVHQV